MEGPSNQLTEQAKMKTPARRRYTDCQHSDRRQVQQPGGVFRPEDLKSGQVFSSLTAINLNVNVNLNMNLIPREEYTVYSGAKKSPAVTSL